LDVDFINVIILTVYGSLARKRTFQWLENRSCLAKSGTSAHSFYTEVTIMNCCPL